MTAHARLRAATAADHQRTDAAFGGFDLADRADYSAFLQAHARILPATEDVLARDPALPPFRPRAPFLHDDLDRLGMARPPVVTVADPGSTAARLGMLYVIEGSRLGGGMLARRVARDLPHSYLSAVHESGEWRSFSRLLDAADAGGHWFEQLLSGARATFAAYDEAARLQRADIPARRRVP